MTIKKYVSALLIVALLASFGGAIPVQPAYAADEYDDLREKQKVMLTGGTAYNTSDPDIAAQLSFITSRGQSFWSTMDTSPTSYLWSDAPGTSVSAHITSSYNRLLLMATAYSTYGSGLYQNSALRSDIVTGLEWLYANRYNETKTRYNNWWDWEIGVPLALNDIVVLMYDDLTAAQITNYMNAVHHFAPDPTRSNGNGNATGANRVWKSRVVALRGIIVKDSAAIAAARNALSPVFDYVTSGDGFYRDGSFIQHRTFSYNGGYGLSLMSSTVSLLYLLDGSSWAVTDPDVANVYRWVYDSFEPFIYKGAVMSMTQGREISRESAQEHNRGAALIQVITRLSSIAPPSDATAFRSMVKHWIQQDTYRSFWTGCPIQIIVMAKAIVGDSSVVPRGELTASKVFNGMDRAVHLRPGFAWGLSMSSNRISNYESINNENRKGWYTGDGMTFLYNGDLAQYDDQYWPTVNPYRLPGTTVDTMTRSNGSGQNYRHASARAGGVVLQELYGLSGMLLKGWNSNLTAQKSWFMFDDEIVALGSGIANTGQSGNGWDGTARKVETIVENRKLTGDGSANVLLVDGVNRSGTPSWTSSGVSWAHLSGSSAGSNIGYYFPGGAALKGLREARTGSWNAINSSESTASHTRSYQTLWFDHGTNPSGQTYAYVLLPGAAAAQVASYASQPDITVLENSSAAHAVKEEGLDAVGAYFWTDSHKWIQVDGSNFMASNKKAAVMTKETDDEIEIAVADPTRLNTGTIEIEINRSAAGVMTADAGVTVTQLSPTIKLSVNVHNAGGKIFNAKISYVHTSPVFWMNEHFDHAATGAAPPGWTVGSVAGTLATVVETPSPTNKSLRLYDTSTTATAHARRSFASQTGETTISFKAMAAQVNAVGGLHARDATGANAITVAFHSSGLMYTYYGATVVMLQPYAANTWYDFKIVARPSNDTFDFYINDTQVVFNQSFRTPATSLNDLYINSSIAETGTFYFDEFKVYGFQ